MKRLLLARKGRLLPLAAARARANQVPWAAAASSSSSSSLHTSSTSSGSDGRSGRVRRLAPALALHQPQQQPARTFSKFKGGSLREKGAGGGASKGKGGKGGAAAVGGEDAGPGGEEELLTIDPAELELPPGTRTDNMTLEEMKTLSDAYKLELRSRRKEQKRQTQDKPDLSHVYAASNDPLEHGPGGKGKPGTVYTIQEAEYKKLFPGPWTKPARVPFETGLNATLGTRHLLIRPAAVEVIGHLQAFAQGRFPKAAEAEALREAWLKQGGLAAVAPKKGGAGEAPTAAAEEAPPLASGAAAESEEGAGAEQEEEAEEDDDYDLFGEEEDEEEAGRAQGKGKGQGKGEGAGYEKRRDSEIFGTLRRLAVDDDTLVHPEQTADLPLTPAPKGKGDGKKSIFLFSGPRGVGKTAALYHTVHYARRAGWVVLLVPSAYEYLHEGGLVRPSPFFKGYFDTPDLAQTTLRQLGEAHGHQLQQLALQDPQALARLGLPKGSTLVDAVALGIARRKLATTALLEVKRALEAQKDYPVMVAVDEFSEWFHPSAYYFALKKVEGSRLVLVKALRDLIPTEGPMAGAHHPHLCVVAARSERFPRWGRTKAMKGKEGRKRLQDLPNPLPRRTPYDVPVDRYSAGEFEAVYKFVADSGLWGANPSLAPETLRAARVATGGNPEAFTKDAIALESRLMAPQNPVGKASTHAPKDFLLSDLLVEIEQAEAASQGGGKRQEAAAVGSA